MNKDKIHHLMTLKYLQKQNIFTTLDSTSEPNHLYNMIGSQ